MRHLWFVFLVACSSPTPRPSPVVPANNPPVEPAPVAAPVAPVDAETPDATIAAAAPSPTPGPLFKIEGDVDGVSGNEEITLGADGTLQVRPGNEEIGADGTLQVGPASVHVDFEVGDGTFWAERAKLEIVDLRRDVRGIFVVTPSASEGEDPPDRFRVYVVKRKSGELQLVLDQVVGTLRSTPLTFRGDGTARYLEDDEGACMRKKSTKQATRNEVSFKLNAAGTKMTPAGRRNTKEKIDCDKLAACPYVYVVEPTGPRMIGEILRDLRGVRAETLQSLAVGAHDGRLQIRLAEHKPEVTYLDEIYAEIDGVRVAPRACDGATPPSYCATDGHYHVMREGDVLDLMFDTRGGAAELFARGYYVPIRAR